MPVTVDEKQSHDGHKRPGTSALDRLQASRDAAETVLKDLRSEVSRDSRELLKDLGKTFRDARRNLARSRRRLIKDLEQIPQALIRGRTPHPPATSAGTRSTGSRRRSTNQSKQTQSRATSA